jgi:hypothetical protein
MTIKSISTVIPAPSVTVLTAPYAPTGGTLIGSSNTQLAFGVPQTPVFVMNEFGLGFAPGVRIRAAVTASPNNWMEGIVQSYDTQNNLTVNLTLQSSTPPVGLQGPWTITVTGAPGQQGPQGIQGPQGAPGVGGAPVDSPVFTGTPQVPTPVLHDNSTVIPNTNWVTRELTYFAPLNSPVFTGTPTAPTVNATDSSTKIATTGMVQAALATMTQGIADAPTTGGPFARKAAAWFDLTATFALYAPLASAALTGTPTAPEAPDLDNTTKIATTNWVNRAISEAVISSGGGIADAPNDGGLYSRQSLTWINIQPKFDAKADTSVLNTYAPIASPTFTGAPSAPTPAPGDSSTKLATTQFITNLLAGSTGATLSVGATPPASPSAGAMWWDTNSGNLYIYYNDGSSSQWVIAVNVGALAPANVLLSTVSASAAAALVMPLTGGFRRYRIALDSIVASAASNILLLQASSDGGATWKTASTYTWSGVYYAAGATGGYMGGSADPGIRLFGANDLSSPVLPGGADVSVLTPPGQQCSLISTATVQTGSGFFGLSVAGRFGDTTLWNALRLICSGSANISGNASIFGIAS